MLNWLRRRLRALERRWIRDPAERSRHQERVRERLPRFSEPAPRAEEPLPAEPIRPDP
ncbi:MAG TPA: hypothetical protein VFM19_09355 [Candidatus Limnocylindria bacterium]|nr:hypothetical protein [Candidatus Limnocylindria bacterium]